MKKCSKCGIEINTKSGYCAKCRKEYNEQNREKTKEYSKKWYEKNKEKIKEHNEQNREKRKNYNKKWKEENKEKIKEYNEQNKEKMKEYRKKRINTLNDSYILDLMKIPVSEKNEYLKIIEVKRIEILIKRKIKNYENN